MDKSGVLARKQGKTCDTSSAVTSLQVPHRLTRARWSPVCPSLVRNTHNRRLLSDEKDTVEQPTVLTQGRWAAAGPPSLAPFLKYLKSLLS